MGGIILEVNFKSLKEYIESGEKSLKEFKKLSRGERIKVVLKALDGLEDKYFNKNYDLKMYNIERNKMKKHLPWFTCLWIRENIFSKSSD